MEHYILCVISILNYLLHINSKYPEIETTTDWDTILSNAHIDRVCIALPAHLHYTFAKKSLEAGKHVYVEKPITLDISQAEELNTIAKEKDLIFNGRTSSSIPSRYSKNKSSY